MTHYIPEAALVSDSPTEVVCPNGFTFYLRKWDGELGTLYLHLLNRIKQEPEASAEETSENDKDNDIRVNLSDYNAAAIAISLCDEHGNQDFTDVLDGEDQIRILQRLTARLKKLHYQTSEFLRKKIEEHNMINEQTEAKNSVTAE